jgi:hypothetical protein
MREKPAQSMAIALVAGWLIGRVLRVCHTGSDSRRPPS